MRFDSLTFWLFFALAWSLWRYAPFVLAKRALLAASLLFYGWWNAWYLLLILFSTLVDYVAGAAIHRAGEPRRRRRWLWLSLASNLGLLATFKYLPFAARSADGLGALLGIPLRLEPDGWVVPVGISFYTFQTLSYTIDLYRGRIRPARSFLDFFLYVSFFPQLVAGPIVRARELLPQLDARRRLSPALVQSGLYHCVHGLFLKVVVADNLAPAVRRVYEAGASASLTPTDAWLGTLYFGVQIYADFAGYSGIAIGLAYLMGLRFPVNFRYPFLARGPGEFWRRWHITLSEWLRDYLYVPLGGNRGGRLATYRNLMLTMVLGGLWHGAAWTFVAWGALHGLALCVERALRGERPTAPDDAPPRGLAEAVSRLAQMLVFLAFLQVTWVLFRAQSFGLAGVLLERMLVAPFREPLGLERLAQARHLLLVLPVVLLHGAQLATEWGLFAKRPRLRAAAATGMLLALLVVSRVQADEFLYFQF